MSKNIICLSRYTEPLDENLENFFVSCDFTVQVMNCGSYQGRSNEIKRENFGYEAGAYLDFILSLDVSSIDDDDLYAFGQYALNDSYYCVNNDVVANFTLLVEMARKKGMSTCNMRVGETREGIPWTKTPKPLLGGCWKILLNTEFQQGKYPYPMTAHFVVTGERLKHALASCDLHRIREFLRSARDGNENKLRACCLERLWCGIFDVEDVGCLVRHENIGNNGRMTIMKQQNV